VKCKNTKKAIPKIGMLEIELLCGLSPSVGYW